MMRVFGASSANENGVVSVAVQARQQSYALSNDPYPPSGDILESVLRSGRRWEKALPCKCVYLEVVDSGGAESFSGRHTRRITEALPRRPDHDQTTCNTPVRAGHRRCRVRRQPSVPAFERRVGMICRRGDASVGNTGTAAAVRSSSQSRDPTRTPWSQSTSAGAPERAAYAVVDITTEARGMPAWGGYDIARKAPPAPVSDAWGGEGYVRPPCP